MPFGESCVFGAQLIPWCPARSMGSNESKESPNCSNHESSSASRESSDHHEGSSASSEPGDTSDGSSVSSESSDHHEDDSSASSESGDTSDSSSDWAPLWEAPVCDCGRECWQRFKSCVPNCEDLVGMWHREIETESNHSKQERVMLIIREWALKHPTEQLDEKSVQFPLGGVQVCSPVWAGTHGVSETVMHQCFRAAKEGAAHVVDGRSTAAHLAPCYVDALSFLVNEWLPLFGECSPTPIHGRSQAWVCEKQCRKDVSVGIMSEQAPLNSPWTTAPPRCTWLTSTTAKMREVASRWPA